MTYVIYPSFCWGHKKVLHEKWPPEALNYISYLDPNETGLSSLRLFTRHNGGPTHGFQTQCFAPILERTQLNLGQFHH